MVHLTHHNGLWSNSQHTTDLTLVLVSYVMLTSTVLLLNLSGVNFYGTGHSKSGVQLTILLVSKLTHNNLTFLSWVLTMSIHLLPETSKLLSLTCLLLRMVTPWLLLIMTASKNTRLLLILLLLLVGLLPPHLSKFGNILLVVLLLEVLLKLRSFSRFLPLLVLTQWMMLL